MQLQPVCSHSVTVDNDVNFYETDDDNSYMRLVLIFFKTPDYLMDKCTNIFGIGYGAFLCYPIFSGISQLIIWSHL